MPAKDLIAKRWYIRGRVQGVGFRSFAQITAVELGVTGYARNLDDGRVEVYAVGEPEKIAEMSGRMHHGPRWADVRGVEEQEGSVQVSSSFQIQ